MPNSWDFRRLEEDLPDGWKHTYPSYVTKDGERVKLEVFLARYGRPLKFSDEWYRRQASGEPMVQFPRGDSGTLNRVPNLFAVRGVDPVSDAMVRSAAMRMPFQQQWGPNPNPNPTAGSDFTGWAPFANNLMIRPQTMGYLPQQPFPPTGPAPPLPVSGFAPGPAPGYALGPAPGPAPPMDSFLGAPLQQQSVQPAPAVAATMDFAGSSAVGPEAHVDSWPTSGHQDPSMGAPLQPQWEDTFGWRNDWA
jgi:hypothetical protein